MSEVQVSLLDLLLFPVTLPVNGFRFLLEQIREAAERERDDPEVLRARLVELQWLYELEEISEDAYREAWSAISDRLAAVEGPRGPGSPGAAAEEGVQ